MSCQHMFTAAFQVGNKESGLMCLSKADYERGGKCVILKFKDGSSCTSLTLLFDAGHNIHSFGSNAQSKYEELLADNIHQDWYFYQDLVKEPVHRTLRDVNRKEMLSRTVYTAVMRFFKDEIFRHLSCYNIHDICFVVVVPDTWALSTHEFLRSAAEEAGMPKEMVRTVPVSLAQLQFCKTSSNNTTDRFIINNNAEHLTTVHVYERQQDGNFALIHQLMRGTCNQTPVYHMTEYLLRHAVVDVAYEEIQSKYKEELSDFENQVREKFYHKIISDNNRIAISYPLSRHLKCQWTDGIILSRTERLTFTRAAAERLWQPYLNLVQDSISRAMQTVGLSTRSTQVCLLGPLSCQYIQEAVSPLILSYDPSWSIWSPSDNTMESEYGGALLGLESGAKVKVLSRYTYAVSLGKLLKPIIRIGQDVYLRPAATKLIVPTKVEQTEIVLALVASTKERSMFFDPSTDRTVGTIHIGVPSSAPSRKIYIEVIIEVLDNAELKVVAKELFTSKIYQQYLAFS